MSKGFIGGDDRTKITNRTDSRSDRESADQVRTQTDGTAFTLDQRRQMLRNEFKQEILPNPPLIPGFHLCWLSTTSRVDPIHNRMRIGYDPVKTSEVYGMDKFNMKDGEYAGFVSCNEMVLFKIPEEVYQMMMTEYHHNIPMEYEKGVRESIEDHNSREDRDGKQIGSIEGDGFKELGAYRPAPVFN